jgi:hypothetical protein
MDTKENYLFLQLLKVQTENIVLVSSWLFQTCLVRARTKSLKCLNITKDQDGKLKT